MATKITDILQERARLIGEQRAILDTAASDSRESRGLSAEEQTNYDKHEDGIRSLDAQIEREYAHAERSRTDVKRDEELRATQRSTENRDAASAAFRKWAVSGENALNAEERSLLYGGTEQRADSLYEVSQSGHAGVLVPTTLSAQLVDKLEQASAVRAAGATVITTAGGNPLNWPVTTAHAAAKGPTAENTVEDSITDTFSTVSFGAFKYDGLAKISVELLQDSVFDLEGYITDEAARKIGRKAGDAYAVGAGTTEPHGLFTAASIGVTTVAANAIGEDDIIDLLYSVGPQYRDARFSANGTPGQAAFIMHDQIAKIVRKLKFSIGSDTVGYAWQPSLTQGQPDLLLGKPVYIEPSSASTLADNALVMAFGDISRYYVRMAGGFNMVRLNERFLDAGLIGFLGWIRTDGQLVDTNAVKTMKVLAA